MEKATKLQFKSDGKTWKKVLQFKLDKGLSNNNDTVETLINLGLKATVDKSIIYESEMPSDEIIYSINEFKNKIPTLEKKIEVPLLILKDNKSEAYYCECHVLAEDFLKLSDPDATIDPELQEEFRANRLLEPDNPYFQQMIDDAREGRQFSDIVIEYDTKYKEGRPLKILGGQHRTESLKEAQKNKVNVNHGIKVYFSLSKDQRAEIMRISNTNINVSPDLRDRIEEHRLTPANMLREFCSNTGILEKGVDFGDKRRYEEEFNPTVRMMRTFIVNYFDGFAYEGDIDEDAYAPYLCKSGKGLDEKYIKVFKKFKDQKSFKSPSLIKAGKNFFKLHENQYKNADKIKGSAKKEYKIKTFSLSIISAWAFTAGVLQRDKKKLNKFYSLPDKSGDKDPLNALAMRDAKHKTIDSESYRGLGTRTDDKERGRLLQLFLNYSASDKPRISKDMCNTAIDIYHANRAKIDAEEKRKKAF